MEWIFDICGGESLTLDLLNGVLWNFNDEVMWFVRAIIILYLLFEIYVQVGLLLIVYKRGILLQQVLLATLVPLGIWLTDTGFVHGLSVGFFFLGVLLAVDKVTSSSWVMLKTSAFVSFSVVCTFLLNNGISVRLNDWLHLAFNVLFFLVFIFVCSRMEIKLPKMPMWCATCSYDIYLVHNKALSFLSNSYTIIPLWNFVGMTTLFTVLFYGLRKIVHI